MSNKELIDKYNEKLVYNSWTYAKLTDFEKKQWEDTIKGHCVTSSLKGREFQKWATLNAVYHAFLMGCGYDSFNWRCTEEEKEIMLYERQ